MDDSGAQSPPHVRQDRGGSPDRVRGWLKELTINGVDVAVGEGDANIPEKQEHIVPITPPRQSYTSCATLEEVSPTDTSFSGHSIFDTRPRGRQQYESPAQRLQFDDGSSEVTSIDGEEYEPKQARYLDPPAAPDFGQRAISPTTTQDSCDISSPEDEEIVVEVPDTTSPSAIPLHDPNAPRLVWITSCLQCTLAGLPCSRTHPSCARCTRKGHSSGCLLYRRRFASETISPSTAAKSGTPILLKVRGEDEANWQRKVELEKKLYVKWAEQQDQKNWVMPSVDGVRGGWRAGRRARVGHPGEGQGRMSFRELVVDENVGV